MQQQSGIYVAFAIDSPERKQDAAAEGRVTAPGAGSGGAGDSGSESAPAADDDCGSSTASSGFGSLTKRRPHGQSPHIVRFRYTHKAHRQLNMANSRLLKLACSVQSLNKI